MLFTEKEAKWQDEFHSKDISQWQWAKKCLVSDKDSRQAIMHYNSTKHQYAGIKDFPCTIYNQFFIRDNKLHLSCSMRSSDVYFGITYDFPFFMLLMQCMRLELLEFYPTLELGQYTHTSGSFHIYEKDFEKIAKMLEHEFIDDKLPVMQENPIYHPELFNLLYNDEFNSTDPLFN